MTGRSKVVLACGAFLALSSCASPAAAQTMVSRITRAESDARVLERTIDIRIEADGRTVRSERRVVEFLTDWAQEVYADPFVIWDSARQRLTVNTARTTDPDGSTQDTPTIGINELALAELTAAPAYASLRETVVTHVGIRPGAKAELAWTLEDLSPPDAGLAGGEVALHWAIPIEKLEVRVSAAANVVLQSACVGCALAPTVTPDGDRTVYAWKAERLEAVDLYESSSHVGGPEDGLDGPRIVFSTARSWDPVVPALSDAAGGGSEVEAAVRARATMLSEGLPTVAQRVEAAQAFVAEDLATIRPPRVAPFRLPAAPAEVLARGYGSPVEKAGLLAALLRAWGVEAVAAMAGPADAPVGVVWPAAFADAWVIELPGGWSQRWLPVDRRGSTAAGGLFAGRMALIPDGPGAAPELLPPAAIETNLADAVVTVKVAGDGTATADVSLTLTGALNPYAGLREDEEDPTIALGDAAAAFLPEGEAGETVLTAFGEERTAGTAEVSGRLEEAGGTLTLPAVWPGREPLPASLFRGSRETPLDLEAPFVRSVRWVVTLPDGWTPLIVPRGVRVDAAVGRFVQEVVVTGSEVRIERRLELDVGRVLPAEYEGLRAIYRAFVTAGAEPVVLGR
jgi:transglutaminase-like putative cysteine protease